MTRRATGTFDVDIKPLPSELEWLGRMRVTKRFRGGLTGDGAAEMLSVGSPVEGSAAYVAIDRVTGALDGRSGSFTLAHTGLMDRNAGTLSVIVTPGSGEGELTGLTGRLDIEIVDGEHRYVFSYEIAGEAPEA